MYRRGRCGSVCWIWLALTAAPSMPAQPPPQDLGTLRLRKPREGNIAPGQTMVFRLPARSGDFLHVELLKKGVDMALSIRDPQGREVVSESSPNFAFGFEHASAIADQAGEYTVRAAAKGTAGPAGRYRIVLAAQRPPGEEDRLRLRAETLFRAAAKDEPARDIPARRRALESYAEAAQLFERLRDPYMKALALHRIGAVYDGLGEFPKALDFYNQALTIRRALDDHAGEGATLNNIAIVYAEQGEKTKALEFYNRAIPARRAAGDRSGVAATLGNMAALYSRSGDKHRAAEVLTQALPIYRALGERAGEARTLDSLAAIYDSTGEIQKAVDLCNQALPIRRALGDSRGEAATLYHIGEIYDGHGESQKALDPFNQALAVYRQAGDRQSEAETLQRIAAVYTNLADNQKALEFYGQALPLLHAAGDQSGEAETLNRVGGLYPDPADEPKALDAYNRALAITRAAGDRPGEASTLENIGYLHNALGRKQEALDFYNRALAMRRAGAERQGEANDLNNLGTVYRDLGEVPKALEYFAQALEIRRALGDRLAEAQTLGNMGISYADLGDRRKALELYSQSLPLKRAMGDRAGEANVLNAIGNAYYSLDENQTAIENYNQALAIYRSLNNRKGEAATLGNLGAASSAAGDHQKALDFSNQALAIDRAIGDRPSEPYALRNLGSVHADMGEAPKALDYYNQALPLFRSTGNRGGESATLMDLGKVYSALGDRQSALDFYRQSLAIQQAIGDRTGAAGSLNDMGNVYSALGDKKRALEFYNQALPMVRAVGDRSAEARSLANIGVAYDDLGDKEKALEFYNRSLPLFRAAGDLDGEAGARNNIGSLHDVLGQKQLAAEFYNQALATFRSVSDRRGEAASLANLSALLRESQPDLAILFGKQAINVLQTVRRDNRGLTASLQRVYEKSIESYYRSLADLLVTRQRFAEAEEILSLLKEKETSDFIRRDAVADQLRPATLVPAERDALARYEQVVGQVAGLGQKKAALIAKESREPLSAAEREQSDQLDRDLGAANMVLERFFAEQEKSFAANSATASRMNALREAEGIQDTLAQLGPDVVAIYTLVMPDKYVAMLVTSGVRKAYTTAIKESELNAKVFEFRKLLQDPGSNPLPLAQELYRIVFPEGLRQDLESIQAGTIMWSIDSTLRYIPISALHDGRDYLVKRFRNSLITPASLARLTDAPKPRWQGVGFGVSEALSGFSALPGVPAELGDIFQQQEGREAAVPGPIRLNAAFTRDAFVNDLRQPNRSVVHIATHFDSRPGEADASKLLLGDGQTWNLRDIESVPRLFNGVDLLTLSACNTAFTNGAEDGREVDSFGAIAQRLGAKGVIASLWSVSDEATARLMQTMYRLRQQNPSSGKNEALREAQDQMASGILRPGAPQAAPDRGVMATAPTPAVNKGSDWRHPYYWAAFILIGNWK